LEKKVWGEGPEKYVVVGKIGLKPLLRVSVRGSALYLYLPKDLVEAYGIMAGDQIEVMLGEIRRREKYAPGAKEDD